MLSKSVLQNAVAFANGSCITCIIVDLINHQNKYDNFVSIGDVTKRFATIYIYSVGESINWLKVFPESSGHVLELLFPRYNES